MFGMDFMNKGVKKTNKENSRFSILNCQFREHPEVQFYQDCMSQYDVSTKKYLHISSVQSKTSDGNFSLKHMYSQHWNRNKAECSHWSPIGATSCQVKTKQDGS